MLLKIFGDNRILFSGIKDDKLVISEDCTEEEYEALKEEDSEWYEITGGHKYWNFTEKAKNNTNK